MTQQDLDNSIHEFIISHTDNFNSVLTGLPIKQKNLQMIQNGAGSGSASPEPNMVLGLVWFTHFYKDFTHLTQPITYDKKKLIRMFKIHPGTMMTKVREF